MATNKKITELTELVEADLADDDVLAIVDVSAGQTFKVRKSTLASALAGVASLAATTPVAVSAGTGSVTISLGTVPITSGGTGATSAGAALTALGGLADPMTTRGDIITRGASTTGRLAVGSANRVLISDGTDPAYGQVPLASAVSGTLPLANGGTNATSAGDARTSLGAAALGANSDITSLTGLTTDLAVTHGGTGASTASAARTNLSAQADVITTRGDMVIGDSSGDAARLAVGTTGQAPVSDGTDMAMTGIHKQGLQTIFVPAMAMRPTSSNGCAALTDVETTAGRPDLQVLDFDSSADEHAQMQVGFSKNWNSGTITFRVFWTSTATDTDTVAWGLQGVSCADGDSADVVYGTAVVVTDSNQSTAEDVYVSPTSAAVTIAGSPGDAEMTFFRVFRDVSADTATEDARLIGIQIFYTTNAADDT
jgi:hypothetical protein